MVLTVPRKVINITLPFLGKHSLIITLPSLIDLFTDSDAIFEKSIPQCIMGYPGYMCIRREVNKL